MTPANNTHFVAFPWDIFITMAVHVWYLTAKPLNFLVVIFLLETLTFFARSKGHSHELIDGTTKALYWLAMISVSYIKCS